MVRRCPTAFNIYLFSNGTVPYAAKRILWIAAMRPIFISLLLALSLSCTSRSEAKGAPPKQVFINQAADIFDMAYDDVSGVLYMTNGGSAIARYDVKQKKSLPSLAVGGTLYGVDISADGKTLAAADTSGGNGIVWIETVDLNTGAIKRISGVAAPNETGTFDVAFYKSRKVVASGYFLGSGDTTVHLADLTAGTLTGFATASNETVLRASADHQTVAFTQGGTSNGPWGIVNFSTPALKQLGAVDWFTYDIGVANGGKRFAVPTYDGTFLFRRSGETTGTLGAHDVTVFNGAVYDPNHTELLYQTLANSNQIEIWNTRTRTLVQGIGANSGDFPPAGNDSFTYGYMKISQNGKLLFTKIQNGVLVLEFK